MLKKAASGVLAILPDLRAHRLAALRGIRAHVLGVRFPRQKGCGLAGGKGGLGAPLGFWAGDKVNPPPSRGYALLTIHVCC